MTTTDMRRLLTALLFIALASPTLAADQWNAGTLTGSGRTETLTLPYTHSTTVATAIPRRATSLTNALTKYTVAGVGAITASTVTPTSRTNFTSINAVGGDGSTVVVGGKGTWLESAALSDLTTWTSQQDTASDQGWAGVITPTSPDKTYQVGTICSACSAGAKTRLLNFSISTLSVGNIATNGVLTDDNEMTGISVNANYYGISAGEYSLGQPRHYGYASGTSFAYSVQSADPTLSTGSYYYPPFAMNGLLYIATAKRVNNAHTYIQALPIAGTITTIDAGAIDLAPICQFDPSGSAPRGWWVNKANGALYKTNSVSAPSSISNDATYDIPSGALGGSTPLFAVCGLDVDGDGVAWTSNSADNPVVFMADGTHFAWWGTPTASGGPLVPQRAQRGPFNNLPFRGP